MKFHGRNVFIRKRGLDTVDLTLLAVENEVTVSEQYDVRACFSFRFTENARQSADRQVRLCAVLRLHCTQLLEQGIGWNKRGKVY